MSNPIESNSTSANELRANPRGRYLAFVLEGIAAYLALSIATLPFVGSLWSGEIPVLGLLQIPKIKVALWLRCDVVMPLIKAFGLSAGSYSPDYMMARPYGLLLAYLIPGMVLFGFIFAGGRRRGIVWRWSLIVVGLLVVDYFFVMFFGTNPWNHFSFY
jgi:hypothetical protein